MSKMTTDSPNKTEHQKQIETLEKQNKELKALVAWYEEQFRLKKHQQYGASSEKLSDDQLELPLFNEAEITAVSVEEVEESSIEKKQKKSPRKTYADTVPVETVSYTLPEEEQGCLSCGNDMHVMKKETRRELQIIPAQVKIIQHEREVYACRNCEQTNISTPIVQAPMPNPVYPKSMASPSAIAYVLIQKYMASVPLYRQEKQFEQLGVTLSRQTLSNWILYVANTWVDPLVQHMKQTLLNQEVLHADETTVQVLQEKERAPTSTSYMWLYRTGRAGPKCVLFDYQTTRASKHPKRYLQGFKGKLHVDGYKGYEGLSGVTLSGCWAHVRRKFDQAQKAAPPKQGGQLTLAEQALKKMGALYKIEKDIASKSFEERLKIRQEQSIPLVEAYFTWLKTIKPQVLPKSKLGEAIQYALNQQKKLEQPFEDGRLDIDNNAAERSIKPFVIGRKNWLFSNSSKGAKSSASIYSLLETAKENNLNVFHYFIYLFKTLPNIDMEDSNQLQKLVPWSTDLPESCYLANHKE
ncbi:IS66 family transposase [Fictibacillus nanhaiensis]|uniref:IS66 family transposase n=1 Tax=Fictibacillus nanhaiensis TaxID=742169 RepID=UPI00203E3FCB|nr:IS66 family transposase [Fictibacillus nanhaiensis]MCM3734230.1 IS66 family transposase [Fictibacillus nanhaiensis]